MKVKVEVSARHIHITENDFKSLFGFTTNLTPVKKLSQEDDFASEETVKLVGPKSTFDDVRIVGPFREYSQAEISFSEAKILGINPPLRISGQLPGVNVKIVGPKGEINKDIGIIAKRHFHLPPDEAQSLGLAADDVVSVKCFGERAVVFNQVVVRIKPKYTTAIHLDTDEGNAAGIDQESKAELIIK